MLKTLTRSLSSIMSKPKVIFVLGPPGSGKGTQCKKIAEKFSYLHLSAGELLRNEMKDESSEHGKLIRDILKDGGKIVPTKITLKLLEKAIKESGNDRVMVDGFPRNQENFEVWNEQMTDKTNLEFVLFLKCSQQTCTDRILERSKTSGRSDDNIDTLKKRFNAYVELTMPVVEFYQKSGKLKTVDANEGVEQVFSEVCKLFD